MAISQSDGSHFGSKAAISLSSAWEGSKSTTKYSGFFHLTHEGWVCGSSRSSGPRFLNQVELRSPRYFPTPFEDLALVKFPLWASQTGYHEAKEEGLDGIRKLPQLSHSEHGQSLRSHRLSKLVGFETLLRGPVSRYRLVDPHHSKGSPPLLDTVIETVRNEVSFTFLRLSPDPKRLSFFIKRFNFIMSFCIPLFSSKVFNRFDAKRCWSPCTWNILEINLRNVLSDPSSQ